MNASPIAVSQDRTVAVPAGAVVKTGYVDCHRVRLACADRMAIGDVDGAYRRRLQLGTAQPWPPPVGEWEEGGDGARTFAIYDGRHEYVAALMAGVRTILVAWVEG